MDFKSSIAKIVTMVLFLKIMLIVDFDDFFPPSVFSRSFSTFSQMPAPHWFKIAVQIGWIGPRAGLYDVKEETSLAPANSRTQFP
jgi:hypothetical protein